MTRLMTRMAVAGCMALAALGAVAAFDAVSATAEAAPDVSPFAGDWSGAFVVTDSVDPEFSAVGTLDWTVSNVGRVTGTFYVDTFGHGGTFAGHVRADGKLMVVMNTDDGGGIPHDGTASIDDAGQLVASATDTWSDVPVSVHTWSIVMSRESD